MRDARLDDEERFAARNYAPLDVVLVRGEGPWVTDRAGKRYLDCLAAYGALNQGHRHPKILAALHAQAGRLTLTSRAFRNDRFGPLCAKLCRMLGFDKALLMNTGAEAVETAIKAARRYAYERRGVPADEALILVFDGNFHGRTTTIVGFSSDPESRRGFGPFAPGFVRAPYGDARAARRAVAGLEDRLAAVLVEPIQGEAGVVVPPGDFLPELRRLCDETGALLVCDEIQSGLGRAGALLASRLFGVEPDAVTLGKALSGGVYPVSAFLARAEVMDVFRPGSHGSTYGGNPLACAVAEAALDVIEEEDLCSRARAAGVKLRAVLDDLPNPPVAEVRGLGLWFGLELAPEARPARPWCEALLAEGVLVKDTHERTIRISPPLALGDDALDYLAAALRKVFAGPAPAA